MFSFKINKLIYVFILYCSCVTIYSQTEYKDYNIKHLTIKDGLSQSTIKTILQDSKGYLWFGTINGLNRYDGYSFKIFNYDPSDSTSLSDDGITTLYEDRNEVIWIGTVKGILNKFERETGNFIKYFFQPHKDFQYNNNLENNFPIVFSRNNPNTITTITEDKYGYL